MVEARMQGSVLKNMVEVIREMKVNDTNFNFSPIGFSLQAIDPTRMEVVDIFLQSDAFKNYCCDHTISIGVNLNNIAKILRSAADDDTIIIKADYGIHYANFIIESPTQDKISQFMMNLVDIDTMPVNGFSKELKFDACVKMPSTEFSRICTDLSIFGDIVSIMVNEKGVGFSSKGDIGTSIILISRNNTSIHKADEEATVIEMIQTVSLNFGLTFLNCFTKATPLSNTVIIYMSNQLHLPVMVLYPIGEKGHLRFFLNQIKP